MNPYFPSSAWFHFSVFLIYKYIIFRWLGRIWFDFTFHVKTQTRHLLSLPASTPHISSYPPPPPPLVIYHFHSVSYDYISWLWCLMIRLIICVHCFSIFVFFCLCFIYFWKIVRAVQNQFNSPFIICEQWWHYFILLLLVDGLRHFTTTTTHIFFYQTSNLFFVSIILWL